MKRLLITDLDNTLYDWVTFFARSFRAMTGELARLLDVPEEELLDEFQALHRELGSVEHPFTTFRLPSVQRAFGADVPLQQLRGRLDPALEAFNLERKRSLSLYPGVLDALKAMVGQGVRVVAHTEASAANASYRLDLLGIAELVERIYVLESPPIDHPDPSRLEALRPAAGTVVEVPRTERKPHPALLRDICRREAATVEEAAYVGDSLTRDVFMAKDAGVTAIWARYGTRYSPDDWATIVRVTHWTDTDVAADRELRAAAQSVEPDYVIDTFDAVLPILGLGSLDGVGGAVTTT